MGLETGTYIQDLNQSNPVGATDPKAQGDDHIRLLKGTAKSTFPNATKAFYFPVTLAKTANYTALDTDENATIEVNAAGGAFTLTLPTLAAAKAGYRLYVAKTDASANAVTVQGLAGELIDGLATLKMRRSRQLIVFTWNGTAWTTSRNVSSAEALSKTVDATLTEDEIDFIVATSTLANTTLTLPAVAGLRGRYMVVKKLTSPFQVILDGNGAETIDGATTYTLNNANEVVVLFCTGAAWLVVARSTDTFNTAKVFSAPVIYSTTTLVDAATIAWDVSVGGPNYKVTLGGNRTLGAFTNGVAGQEGLISIIEDVTGGRTLAFDAAYKFAGGFTEGITLGASEETLYRYRVLTGGATMELRRLYATALGSGGRDLLAEAIASGSGSIDFVLTKWLQLYDRFELDFEDVLAATDDVQFRFRTSTNGGSSYDSAASDYGYAYYSVGSGANGAVAASADSSIVLIDNGGGAGASNVAGETIAGRIIIHNPRAVQKCKVTWDITYMTENTVRLIERIMGGGLRNTAADVDAIRCLMSPGNIASGTFYLYGVRK